MLSTVMLGIGMLRIIMLSVVIICVILLTIVILMLSYFMLSAITAITAISFYIIMLSFDRLIAFLLSHYAECRGAITTVPL
jgi:hypothetical protein